jgi:hypothetical protein
MKGEDKMKSPRWAGCSTDDVERYYIRALELCLEDMESKDLGRIENRIEEVKFVIEKSKEI